VADREDESKAAHGVAGEHATVCVAEEEESEIEAAHGMAGEDATMCMAEEAEDEIEAAHSMALAGEDATIYVAQVAEEMRMIVASPLGCRSLGLAWLSLHSGGCLRWRKNTTGSQWTWLRMWNPIHPYR